MASEIPRFVRALLPRLLTYCEEETRRKGRTPLKAPPRLATWDSSSMVGRIEERSGGESL
jgi:hypothetical protein